MFAEETVSKTDEIRDSFLSMITGKRTEFEKVHRGYVVTLESGRRIGVRDTNPIYHTVEALYQMAVAKEGGVFALREPSKRRKRYGQYAEDPYAKTSFEAYLAYKTDAGFGATVSGVTARILKHAEEIKFVSIECRGIDRKSAEAVFEIDGKEVALPWYDFGGCPAKELLQFAEGWQKTWRPDVEETISGLPEIFCPKCGSAGEVIPHAGDDMYECSNESCVDDDDRRTVWLHHHTNDEVVEPTLDS